LRRAARRLRLVAMFATALVELVILFAAWVTLNGNGANFPALKIETGGLPPMLGAISLVLFGLLIGLIMLRAAALLRAVEAGQVFPARPLRGFALWLFLTVLYSVLGPPLLSLATGAHRLDLDLGGSQLLMLLITALLFFVARLLDEAQRLADDHSQIV
jgi:MFS-type transporter involved in bile tolerance (Atg22 family)